MIADKPATALEKPLAPARRLTARTEFSLVLLGHFLLTSLFSFPLILNFGTALPGQLQEDIQQNIWNLWWVKEAVLHLRNPFWTDFIYYPEGVSLYFHTLAPLNGLISLPIQLLFGVVAGYNFIVFFSFIMAGLGSYRLLKYLTKNATAAFAASLIFAYAPYHLATLKGLLQLIALEWLPFYILYLLKAGHEPEKRRHNIGLAAFFLLCTALTDWYYTLFLLGFTLLYLVWLGFLQAKKNWPALQPAEGSPNFWAAAAVLPLFFIAILPVLIPMLRELGSTAYYLPDPNDTRKFSADLLAFFLPPTTLTLLGQPGQAFQPNYLTGPLADQVYLGYLSLGLGLVGLLVNRRTLFWGVTGALFWVMSLGPALRVNGSGPGWPLPYALIENWPVVKIMRSPDRFNVITMLCLAVCAAFGLSWLTERSQTFFKIGPGRWLVPGLAAGLIVLEFLQIPYPLNSYPVSPFFEQLGQDASDYALVEVPAQGGFWSGAPRMGEQTVHHKRILDGYISREYNHPFQQHSPGFQELTSLKFDSDIWLPAQGENPTPGQVRRAWYDALSYYKVRYIILRQPQNDKQRATANLDKQRAVIAKIAPGQPVYQDDKLAAYAVPTLAEQRPFIEIGEGWYAPELTTPATPIPTYHRWAAGPASLNLVWQGPGNFNSTLSLTLGLLDGEKIGRISLDNHLVWSGKISGIPQVIKIALTLSPGKHRLDLEVDGPATSPKALGLGNDTRALLFFATGLLLN